jgi:hypothetical protein
LRGFCGRSAVAPWESLVYALVWARRVCSWHMSLQEDLRVLGGSHERQCVVPVEDQGGQRYKLPDSVRVDAGHFT